MSDPLETLEGITLLRNDVANLQLQLDPTLVVVVDRYLLRRKEAILQRLIMGEAEYKGAWRTKELWELRQMIAEEIDDKEAYTAMYEWRRDIDGAQG